MGDLADDFRNDSPQGWECPACNGRGGEYIWNETTETEDYHECKNCKGTGAK